MNFFLEHRGELAALTAAAIWAVSSTLYGQIGKQVAPLTLNLTKGLLAIGYLIITMLLTGERLMIAPVNYLAQWWPLLLSGLIGIAWGDTFFFMALNSIGARLTLLINILSPVITALMASLYLGEQLAWVNYLGIALAVAGVAGVIFDRTTEDQLPKNYWQGVLWAVLSALANSIASICSRQAMLAGDLSPTVTTLVRLLAGTVGILLLMLWRKSGSSKLSENSDRFLDRKMWLRLAVVAFFSTYLGINLQQAALKYTAAGIAQTVGSTSPLFVLAYDWWQGKKINWRSIFWAMVAIGGMSLLFR
jgi:drug/metabolite transporter (DMT)-like permease